MHLLPLLHSYAPIPVLAPPALAEADAPPAAFRALVDAVIELALAQGSTRASLSLLTANVVVEPSADEEPDFPAPGPYVSLTLQGSGDWTSDWRWGPGEPAPSGVSSDLLARAGVRFAYGRALGGSSAITIFLAPA